LVDKRRKVFLIGFAVILLVLLPGLSYLLTLLVGRARP
jgi:hypothetical protein